MDKKKTGILFIGIIIIVAMVLLLAYHYNGPMILQKYEGVNVTSTFSADIPTPNNITNQTIDNITIMNDTENNLTIASYNCEEKSFDDLVTEGSKFLAIKNSYKDGAEKIKLANQTVWHNKKTGTYMVYYSLEESHDHVIIVSNNNNTLAHIISTVNNPSKEGLQASAE